jgi:hypothetical protein
MVGFGFSNFVVQNEIAWMVNCGPNLIWLISKGCALIVLDVSDVMEGYIIGFD